MHLKVLKVMVLVKQPFRPSFVILTSKNSPHPSYRVYLMGSLFHCIVQLSFVVLFLIFSLCVCDSVHLLVVRGFACANAITFGILVINVVATAPRPTTTTIHTTTTRHSNDILKCRIIWSRVQQAVVFER